MVNFDTVSMSVSKSKPLTSAEKKIAFSIIRKIIAEGAEANTLKGIVGAQVKVRNNHDEECALINVVQMGLFKAEAEMSEDELHHRVKLQMVPQLMPYLRSTISVLAAEAGLAPIVLPTMDILKSMRKNA